MPDAAKPEPGRIWTQRAANYSPHYFQSDDRWTLHYETYLTIPRWTVADLHTGRAHPNGSVDPKLGADEEDKAV